MARPMNISLVGDSIFLSDRVNANLFYLKISFDLLS